MYILEHLRFGDSANIKYFSGFNLQQMSWASSLMPRITQRTTEKHWCLVLAARVRSGQRAKAVSKVAQVNPQYMCLKISAIDWKVNASIFDSFL